MRAAMKQQEAIDPRQVTLLGVDRVVRQSYRGEKSPVDLWMVDAQQIVGRFDWRLEAAGYCRMIAS